MVGQRTDLVHFDHLVPSSRVLDSVNLDLFVNNAVREGVLHSDWGIDYIVIPPHVAPQRFPPYLVGRWRWDNSLLLDLILAGVPSVDATATNPAVHLGGGTHRDMQLQRRGGQFNNDLARMYYGEAFTLGRINNTKYMLMPSAKVDDVTKGEKPAVSLSVLPRATLKDPGLLLALHRSSTPRFHQLDSVTGDLVPAYPFLLLVVVWEHWLTEAKTWVLVANRLLGKFQHYVFLAMDATAYKTLMGLYPDRVLKGEFWLPPSSNNLAIRSNMIKKLVKLNVDVKIMRVDDLLRLVDYDTEAKERLREPCDVTSAAGADPLEIVGLRPTPAGAAFWASYQECFLSEKHETQDSQKKIEAKVIKCLAALNETTSPISSPCHSSLHKPSLPRGKYQNLISLIRSAATLQAPSFFFPSTKSPVAMCTLPKVPDIEQSPSNAFVYSPARLDLFTQRILTGKRPLVDKLHLILVVYSPVQFTKRVTLTEDFIRRIESRHAKYVELYVVELVYGDQKFMVTNSDNPHHLQLRTSVPMWHKENLINLGVKKLLPPDWKAMAWVDAEVEFESPTWAVDALKLLTGNECGGSYKDVVQLFSHAVNTGADGLSTAEEVATGFGYNYQRGLPYKGYGKGFWHPGFGWAMNRKAYDQVGGLFEHNILGAGDTVFARSMLGMFDATVPATNYWGSEGHFRAVLEWQSKTKSLRMGYVPGIVRHHFHGSMKDRKYMNRLKILQSFVYDPVFHLTKDADSGVITPSPKFPAEAMDTIVGYFKDRKEDGDTMSEEDTVKALPESSHPLTTLVEISNQPLDDNDKLHLIVVIPPVLATQLSQGRIRSECQRKVNRDTPMFLQRMLDTHSAISKHLEVYVVEMVYDNDDFQITSADNPQHLRLRTHVPLWHKENLINLGIKRLLPPNWKAMAWVDAELEFESPTWLLDTLRLLFYGNKDVVQLFSHAVDTESSGSASTIFTGFAYNHERGMPYKDGGLDYWHPGIGWAWSRKAYDAVGGLYEFSAFGGGTTAQAWALAGFHSSPPAGAVFDYITGAAREAIIEYENRLNEEQLKIGYIPGVVRRGACRVEFPDFTSTEQLATGVTTIDTAEDFSVNQGHKGLIYEYATVGASGSSVVWQKLPQVNKDNLYVSVTRGPPKVGGRWMEPYMTKEGKPVLVSRGWHSDIQGTVSISGTVELLSNNTAGDGVDVYLEVNGKRIGEVYTILPTDRNRIIEISKRLGVEEGTQLRIVINPRLSSTQDYVSAHFRLKIFEHFMDVTRWKEVAKVLKEMNFDPRSDLLAIDTSGLLYPSEKIVTRVTATFSDGRVPRTSSTTAR